MYKGRKTDRRCLPYPLQQGCERRPVLTQIVQQLAYIRVGFCQNSEAVARADLRYHEHSPFVFQDRGAESATSGPETQTRGILREGSGERGQGFGLERLMRGMLDGKSIGAQHQYCLDALPLNETAYHFSQTGHPIDLRGGWKSTRNVRIGLDEVNNAPAIDLSRLRLTPFLPGLNLPA